MLCYLHTSGSCIVWLCLHLHCIYIYVDGISFCHVHGPVPASRAPGGVYELCYAPNAQNDCVCSAGVCDFDMHWGVSGLVLTVFIGLGVWSLSSQQQRARMQKWFRVRVAWGLAGTSEKRESAMQKQAERRLGGITPVFVEFPASKLRYVQSHWGVLHTLCAYRVWVLQPFRDQ